MKITFGKDTATLNLLSNLSKQIATFQILVLQRLDNLDKGLTLIMAPLSQLQADVAAETSTEKSVIALLTGLKQQLDAAIAANDPAALSALSAQIEANTTAMAAAVAANTPSATPAPGGTTTAPSPNQP